LLKKLGIKPGVTTVGIAVPPGVSRALALGHPSKSRYKPEVIVTFVSLIADAAARSTEAIALYERGAALWFGLSGKKRDDQNRYLVRQRLGAAYSGQTAVGDLSLAG